MLLIKNQMHLLYVERLDNSEIDLFHCFILECFFFFFLNHTYKKMWGGEDTSYIVQMEMVGSIEPQPYLL